MIRVCDGTDEGLRREQVDRIAASGQESTAWRPCDCGLKFDDNDRLTVYPHQFIHGNLSREERVELGRRVDELVAGGRTAEEIRQWLTSQPVSASLEASPTTTEGSPMGEGNAFSTDQNTGYTDPDATGVVAADTPDESADSAATEELDGDTDLATADEAAERRENQDGQ